MRAFRVAAGTGAVVIVGTVCMGCDHLKNTEVSKENVSQQSEGFTPSLQSQLGNVEVVSNGIQQDTASALPIPEEADKGFIAEATAAPEAEEVLSWKDKMIKKAVAGKEKVADMLEKKEPETTPAPSVFQKATNAVNILTGNGPTTPKPGFRDMLKKKAEDKAREMAGIPETTTQEPTGIEKVGSLFGKAVGAFTTPPPQQPGKLDAARQAALKFLGPNGAA